MGLSLGQIGLAPFTGGLSLLPEDARSKIPVVGALTGAKGNAQKDLERTQQQLAKEMEQRARLVQQRELQQQTQRLTAFGPLNQYVANSLGPEAAFSPEMMGDFAKDPMGGPQIDPSLVDYRGTDPKKQAQVEQYLRLMQEEQAREEARRQQLTAAFTLPQGTGPKPIQMSAPAAAKRRV